MLTVLPFMVVVPEDSTVRPPFASIFVSAVEDNEIFLALSLIVPSAASMLMSCADLIVMVLPFVSITMLLLPLLSMISIFSEPLVSSSRMMWLT